MTQEEKAKAYDELFVKAKQIYNKENDVLIIHTIEDFFPKLKESEDEKIRKALIDGFNVMKESKNCGKTFSNHNIPVADILAWLEKQESEPKWCHHEVDLSGCSEEYSKGYYDGWNNCNQQHAQLDAEQKPAWSEEDNKMSRFIGNAITADDASIYLKSKGIQIIDAHIWLEELKDRVQPQPKQEWSEEDETALSDALWCCKQAASIAKDENDMGNAWYAKNWLKSLRPKSQWKPSDEQMEALSAINVTGSISYAGQGQELINLFNDLKKLKS